ncbi:hypothetical protein BGZ83_002163 [Gryganskiella cystojenkinii]|nr:hypothetical protein BGZ83_002163 [Gryganskiella cystojenkinii]
MEPRIRLPFARLVPIESFNTFVNNIGHVHHLILAGPIPKELYLRGYHFRNLKTLKLGNWSYIQEAQEDEQAVLLGLFISADTCPVLKELSLSEIRSVPLHPFWQALQDSKTIDTFRWLGGYKELRCSSIRWAGDLSSAYWLQLPMSIRRDEFLAGFCFKNLHHVEFDSLNIHRRRLQNYSERTHGHVFTL